MAAFPSSRGVASLGKRVVTQIWTRAHSTCSLSTPSARFVHTSVYDKNMDDHVSPVVVPDDIIQPESEKYWAPNPHTGVFGPASEHNLAMGGERGVHTSSPTNGGGSESSVLEEKAFFRPLEDLDKPQHP